MNTILPFPKSSPSKKIVRKVDTKIGSTELTPNLKIKFTSKR